MDESARSGEMSSDQGQLARVSDVTGTNVKNSKGENLGEIENLMIDTSSGRIAYAVIGYGGVVGMGEKYVAVPWQSVQWAPSQSVAMVNADKSTFDSLAFTGDKWPDLASSEYRQKIQGKFQSAPTGQVYGYVAPTGEQRTKAWSNDSKYNKMFKTDAMTKIDGTIQSVGTFRPEPGAEPGLRLRIQTSDNQTMIVHAGPTAFAEEKGITFVNAEQQLVAISKADLSLALTASP
jgi:sporulation protein YlmC with PRC-barrel domain